MELITIEGIVYKSSKNHLVRNSYGVKSKLSCNQINIQHEFLFHVYVLISEKRGLNLKSDKFIVATNGKKLCRIRSIKQLPGNSSTKISSTMNTNKLISSTVQKVNYKNNLRYVIVFRAFYFYRRRHPWSYSIINSDEFCFIFQQQSQTEKYTDIT